MNTVTISLYVANIWLINVPLTDGLEDVYVAETNQYG